MIWITWLDYDFLSYYTIPLPREIDVVAFVDMVLKGEYHHLFGDM